MKYAEATLENTGWIRSSLIGVVTLAILLAFGVPSAFAQFDPAQSGDEKVAELLQDHGMSVDPGQVKVFKRIRGVATTGANTLFGQPLFDIGPPFGTIGLPYIGAFNELGGDPLPLTPDMPPSTVIATIADPITLSLYGLTPDDVPAELVNLPLRDLPIEVNPLDTSVRVPLPDILDAGPADLSRASPSRDDITLGQWMLADGDGVIICGAPLGREAEALVSLKLRGLIERGLYTIWGVFATSDSLFAIPLGGVPNAVVVDRNGRARFERDLNFCPVGNRAPEDLRLVWIDVLYHPDHRAFGTYPDDPTNGHYPGVHSQVQLEFLVNGMVVDP